MMHPFHKTRGDARNARPILLALALGAAGALLFAGNATAAAVPDVVCAASKHLAAGKYGACAAKARKTYLLSRDAAKYSAALSKCDGKLTASWGAIEGKGGCAIDGDLETMRDFVGDVSAISTGIIEAGLLPPPGCSSAGFDIVFELNEPVPLAALDFDVEYIAAPGGFEGVGANANCTSLLVGSLMAVDDDEVSSILGVGLVVLDGFNGPDLPIVSCRFQSNGTTPVPEDFVIVTIAASDELGNPMIATVSVASITAVP